jgi:hypothetical protein
MSKKFRLWLRELIEMHVYINIFIYVYYLSIYSNGEAAIAMKTPWGRNVNALESPGHIFTKLRKCKHKLRAFVCNKINKVTMGKKCTTRQYSGSSTYLWSICTTGEYHPTGKCMQRLYLRLRSCLRTLVNMVQECCVNAVQSPWELRGVGMQTFRNRHKRPVNDVQSQCNLRAIAMNAA